MDFIELLNQNYQAVLAAVVAALVSLLIREWLQSRKRLTQIETKHKAMETNMTKLENTVMTMGTELTRCSTSVAREVGELHGEMKMIAESQKAMSDKLDRLIEKRKDDAGKH